MIAQGNFSAELYAGLFQEAVRADQDSNISSRRRQLDALLKSGIPGRKAEAFKYFSLRDLSHSAYSWQQGRQGFAAFKDADLPNLNMALTNLVFVNGRFYGSFGEKLDAVNIETNANIRSVDLEPGSDENRFFESVLTIFLQEETRVRIAPHAKGVKIAIHELIHAKEPVFFVNDLRVELGEGAESLISFQSSVNPDESGKEQRHHCVTRFSVDVQKHAQCRVFADWSKVGLGQSFRLFSAQVQEAAQCTVASLSYGPHQFRCNTRMQLLGPDAHCGLFGLIYGQEKDLIDHHTDIIHAAAQTTSRQVYKIVGQGASRSVFNGRIHVVPGVHAIDAHQLIKGMLGSPEAEIDAKPDLRIESDDVKCSHGASVGGINPDQLFYFLSRGVDEVQAKALLARGFLDDLVERVPDADLRDLFKKPLDAMLNAEEAQHA